MKYLLLLILTFNIFAQAEMQELRIAKKEMQGLNQMYSDVDSIIDGLSLHADFAMEAKTNLKQKLKDEILQRLDRAIQGKITQGKNQMMAIIKEEKCISNISLSIYYDAALLALPNGDCAQLTEKIEELKGA